MALIPQCLYCGACCFGDNPRYVRLEGDDHARLGEDAERLTQWLDNRVYMRMAHGHCAALRVVPGTNRFECTIYDRRPATCRELERGSPACRAEFMEKRRRTDAALLTGK